MYHPNTIASNPLLCKRVALARAVYARTKYVLLDDPLSAVVRILFFVSSSGI